MHKLVDFLCNKRNIARMNVTARQTIDAEKTKQLVLASGRTKKWLADKCGISVPYLNLILNDKRSPGRPLVKLLAIALDVDEEALTKAAPRVRAS